jgi:hypothetical protein
LLGSVAELRLAAFLVRSRDNRRRERSLRPLQLSLKICPNYTPNESNLPTQERCSRDQKVELPGYWDERYMEKGVTTVTQRGSCVFHFRVSDAESLNYRHSRAYTLKERK